MLEGHELRVRGLAFAPDGKSLASASWDRTVRLWDTTTGKMIHKLEGHTGDVFSVAMKYDGATLNVTITDTSTLASASQSYAVNIPGVIGSEGAYVGFTGGTGGQTTTADITNWMFTRR